MRKFLATVLKIMAAEISKKAESFDRIIRNGITLAEFDALWCAPCRLQRAIMEQLAERYKGRVSVTGFNVDDCRQLAMRLNITSVPTLILFKNGKEVRRFIGLQSDKILSSALAEELLINSDNAE